MRKLFKKRFDTTNSQPAAAVSDADDVADAHRRVASIAALVLPWLRSGESDESVRALVGQHIDRFTVIDSDVYFSSRLPRLGSIAFFASTQDSSCVVLGTILEDSAGVYGLIFNDAGRWYAVVKSDWRAKNALFELEELLRNKTLKVIKSIEVMPDRGILLELHKEFAEARRDDASALAFKRFESLLTLMAPPMGDAYLRTLVREDSENFPLNWNTPKHIKVFEGVFRPLSSVMLPVYVEPTFMSFDQPYLSRCRRLWMPADSLVNNPYIFDGEPGNGKTAAAVWMKKNCSEVPRA